MNSHPRFFFFHFYFSMLLPAPLMSFPFLLSQTSASGVVPELPRGLEDGLSFPFSLFYPRAVFRWPNTIFPPLAESCLCSFDLFDLMSPVPLLLEHFLFLGPSPLLFVIARATPPPLDFLWASNFFSEFSTRILSPRISSSALSSSCLGDY